MQVLTVVEAKVSSFKQKEFENSFRAAKNEPVPPGLVTSALIKNSKAPETYKIQTVWESIEALQKMRESTPTPKAVELFQRVGAQPSVKIYQIVESVP